MNNKITTNNNKFLYLVALLFCAMFIVGLYNYLLHGHHAYNVTREHPWGIMIAAYSFFVGLSTGVYAIVTIANLVKISEFNDIKKESIIVSLATLMAGFLIVMLEVGDPIKMIIYSVLSPNLSSALLWDVYGYMFFMILIFIELLMIILNKTNFIKEISIVALVVVLSVHANLGGVFGFLVARETVNGSFYPLFFVLISLISGSFVLIFLYAKNNLLFEKLKKIVLILLFTGLFFELWNVVYSLYGNRVEIANVIEETMFSNRFLVYEISLGFIIPIIFLLSKTKSSIVLSIVSLMGLFGLFYARFNTVINAQMMPMRTYKLSEYSQTPIFNSYNPSSTEFFISFGGIGLAIVFFIIAKKILLKETV